MRTGPALQGSLEGLRPPYHLFNTTLELAAIPMHQVSLTPIHIYFMFSIK